MCKALDLWCIIFCVQSEAKRYRLEYALSAYSLLKEINVDLYIPRELREWIDANRGEMSRQAFIIKFMFKIKEMDEMKK